MPIDCVTGKIGAGNTYHVVAHCILKALRARRKILTNIEGLQLRELSIMSGIPLSEIEIELIEYKREWESLLRLDE